MKKGSQIEVFSCITQLKGVGSKVAAKLQRLGINKISDLLFHLPIRYENRTTLTTINCLQAGCTALIEGTITTSEIIKAKRQSLLCRIADHSGTTTVRFFHFNQAQKNSFYTGARIRCYGEPRLGNYGLEMYHPYYQLEHNNLLPELESALTPVYPTTDGLSQNLLRKLIDQALLIIQEQSLSEVLPQHHWKSCSSICLTKAIQFLHKPPIDDISLEQQVLLEQHCHPIQFRLAFEELVAHYLSLLQLRAQVQAQHAPSMKSNGQLIRSLYKQLPFTLTNAQQRVAAEIAINLNSNNAMLRLVQGDVGSGKTIIAALAVLQAVEAGYQAAFMAPTTMLAEQHYQNFQTWMAPLGICIGYLTGKQNTAERNHQTKLISDGKAQIIIGTHALFQQQINFKKLGLIIIDEQHRFGVHQRLELQKKGHFTAGIPHQLIMTATPIPRTLAMCAYADLDYSVIDELPPGRQQITTLLVTNNKRAEIIKRIYQACKEGQQAYWVCTLIEESEVLQCEAAETIAANLKKNLPDLKIGLVHGRLSATEKSTIMASFKAGNIDLLVATTVIEVGVDVPNASLMIIDNPERLGLAQLHQLRGRIGRGTTKSYCVLLYHAPLSLNAKQRLLILRNTNDGFKIAEEDMALRGPGEVMGTKQTGTINFKIADLIRDQFMLADVKACAEQMLTMPLKQQQALLIRWQRHGQQYYKV